MRKTAMSKNREGWQKRLAIPCAIDADDKSSRAPSNPQILKEALKLARKRNRKSVGPRESQRRTPCYKKLVRTAQNKHRARELEKKRPPRLGIR